MAEFQITHAVRPILPRGSVSMPIVSRALVAPKDSKAVAKLAKKGQGFKLDADVVAEIVARRQRGQSYAVICEALNVSMGTVRRYTSNITPPSGGWPNCWQTGKRNPVKLKHEFVARLRRAGFSYQEIGEEFGCSGRTIIAFLDPTRYRKGGRAPVSELLRHVAIVSGYKRPQLRKMDGHSCRVEPQTKARHIAFWILRHYKTKLSYPLIGKSLGGYDHSTVIHGVRRAERVAAFYGITTDLKPRTAARALWNADWRKVGK